MMKDLNQKILTTESVSEGHPDKIADQIAEAVLDFCLAKDSNAHVACEVFINDSKIFVGGELKSAVLPIDEVFKEKIEKIVWKVIKDDIGFDEKSWQGLNNAQVKFPIHSQSAEIDDLVDEKNAGDNSTVFGFANSDYNYYPLFQTLSNLILQKINKIRKTKPELQKLFQFAPDGKIQLIFTDKQLYKVVLCQQFLSELSEKEKQALTIKIKKQIIDPILLSFKLNTNYFLRLQPFHVGGPVADSGLTGRKLMIDTYGTFSLHGGGSFAGKDPSKADRSLALFARFIAKHIVALGLVKEITVQISASIGESNLVNITVLLKDTTQQKLIEQIIKEFFNWNLSKIISQLNLRQTCFLPFATYGYFARSDVEASWEQLIFLTPIQNWIKKQPVQ